MKRLFRCMSASCRVAPAAAAGRRGVDRALSLKVPAGHVPVHVGEGDETERFVVPAELLGRPAIAELLRRAAQEYGYAQRGPLRLPCPAAAFRRLLGALAGGAADAGLPRGYCVVV